MSPFMDVKECAELIRANRSTIYSWSAQNRIPSRKVNGKLLFLRDEVMSWVEGQTRKPNPASLSKFQTVRQRLRSLKTEVTVPSPQSPERK
jgi:excisionase family DNA binding protein